ncbi:MAG: 3-deoxy-manno-octulosonate cytidylyltransferase [Candidatus Brocadiia bacterium]
MEAVVIIPARYESTRLPGKPILEEARDITGKYIVQHVYDRASRAPSVSDVVIATDDVRIQETVESFGGKVRMTSADHSSGTDRIAEVARDLTAPIIVNVQGDEPQIEPEQIEHVIQLLDEDSDAVMGTLAHPITDESTWLDPNAVKVVTDENGAAMYFSRSPIPYVRDSDNWIEDTPVRPLRHLGVYSYRREFLLAYADMPRASYEEAEKLEQLRALQAAHRIKVGITSRASIGIDTPEDLEKWLSLFRNDTD